ncbi:unnamed protein product [Blepharisma stoltei]|uniref:Uncharacterized protein n=1 Tax=Blepharisma stoltei TaxID=1481888 RepID=A0AAU9K6M6_9CILI|nr:unnamed protein product [Blepharisma stoltei]
MIYICKGLANCCNCCCKCCNSCIEGCCKCLDCKACKCCTTAFAPCVFLNFFLMFLPFIVCWVIAFTYWSNDCSNPLEIFLLIQGILFLANFLICIYLMIKYKNKNEKERTGNDEIWKKTAHLMCYDVILCLYFLVFAFEIAWNIVGHNWVAGQDCSESSLPAMTIVALILMWVFIGLGIFMFMCTILTLACEEGSCGFEKCCSDLCYICFCCCLFTKPREKHVKKARTSREVRTDGGNSQPKFIGSAIGLLRMIGINAHWKNRQNNEQANQVGEQNQQQQMQGNAYSPQPVYRIPQDQGVAPTNYINTANQGVVSGINYQPQYQVPQSYPYAAMGLPNQQPNEVYLQEEPNPPKEGIFTKIKKKLRLN